MNGAQAHLLLNHLPVLGVPFGLLLLGAGILRRSDELKKAALCALVATLPLVLAAYLTGEPAEEVIHGVPAVSGPAIEQHEESAALALYVTLALGVAAFAGLLVLRRRGALPAWLLIATLLLALSASVLLAWTASLGGRVHHPELREGFSPPE